MENVLVSNNIDILKLRGILRMARKHACAEEALQVSLVLWDYGESLVGNGRIEESIGIYRSGTGEGTKIVGTLEEARKYIKGWKEETNGSIT